jgi:hypothetical protein
MPDITTTQIFSDGEKGITATKLNNIIANSVIQPDFVTAKPSSSTLDPTDQLLEVKGAGTYARITGSQLISSVSAQVDVTPQIYSVRLRSTNSLGNPNFEVDQRNIGNTVANPAQGAFIQDRWSFNRAGSTTGVISAGRTGGGVVPGAGAVLIPGTNYAISATFLRITLTTAQASLAAGDFMQIIQQIEAPLLRELGNDVHSVSLLGRSSVAGLVLPVSLRHSAGTQSLVTLASFSSANTWTLCTFPNLPVWPSVFNSVTPGNVGYTLSIGLAAGSTLIAPAAGSWQSGNFLGAPGASNFLASPVNSTFDIAFVQHEPGSQCTTLIDKPFTQNYDECLRYYQKTYDYATVAGTATAVGVRSFVAPAAGATSSNGPAIFHKPMAKTPTVTLYNWATGAANSVRDGLGVDHASATGVNINQTGLGGVNFATGVTAATAINVHYIADAGW